MASLRTTNLKRVRKRLWAWWRPRFDSGDFNAFLMSLDWKDKSIRYFRTPKDPFFHGAHLGTNASRSDHAAQVVDRGPGRDQITTVKPTPKEPVEA